MNNTRSSLKNDLEAMLKMRLSGLTLREIASKFNTSRQRIFQILGKTKGVKQLERDKFVESLSPESARFLTRKNYLSAGFTKYAWAKVVSRIGRPTVADRFWLKVNKSGGENACWIWMGSKTTAGYGRFWSGLEHVFAHRFSYEMASGIKPGSLWVCHKCDNPKCVNPNHLFLGTSSDNALDAVAKGRRKPQCGEMAGNSKLTGVQVLEIFNSTENTRKTAKKYSVCQSTVCNIKNRHGWRHLTCQ